MPLSGARNDTPADKGMIEYDPHHARTLIAVELHQSARLVIFSLHPFYDSFVMVDG
jgi:hypothetical protein